MLGRLFSGHREDDALSASLASASWSVDQVIATVGKVFETTDKISEDGDILIYGIEEKGLKFVLVMLQDAPASGRVVQLAIFTKLVGFGPSAQQVDEANASLQISVAQMETGGDVVLSTGLDVRGDFDDAVFTMFLLSWRRDLVMALRAISGADASMSMMMPGAQNEAAMAFASITAPRAQAADTPFSPSRAGEELLARFMGGADKVPTTCPHCKGRGRQGRFFTSMCEHCGGTGLIS